MLLAVVSKNEESVALEAIDRPARWCCARRLRRLADQLEDKAANIAEMTAALNLGLQSVVFIDDNPHERARVREALPEVLVPEWPVEPAQYRRALLSLTCFDSPSLTDEDVARTSLYATERKREALLRRWARSTTGSASSRSSCGPSRCTPATSPGPRSC